MRYSTSIAPDPAVSAQNTVLAASVSKVLRRLRRGESLDTNRRKVLESGAELLAGIVNGSKFIESADPSRLLPAPSTDDVLVYNHALAVIENLKLSKTGRDLTPIFTTIRDQLTSIAKAPDARRLEQKALLSMEQFFNVLHSLFHSDVTSEATPQRRDSDLPSVLKKER